MEKLAASEVWGWVKRASETTGVKFGTDEGQEDDLEVIGIDTDVLSLMLVRTVQMVIGMIEPEAMQ